MRPAPLCPLALLQVLLGCDPAGEGAAPAQPVAPPLTFRCDEGDAFTCSGLPGPSPHWTCSYPSKDHPTLALLSCYSEEQLPLSSFGDIDPKSGAFSWPGHRQPAQLLYSPQATPVGPTTPVRVWIYWSPPYPQGSTGMGQ